MIFSEIYGLYYEIIRKIIQKALKKPVMEKEIRDIIRCHAFPESAAPMLALGQLFRGFQSMRALWMKPPWPISLWKTLSAELRIRWSYWIL